jgi:hypothetical protein
MVNEFASVSKSKNGQVDVSFKVSETCESVCFYVSFTNWYDHFSCFSIHLPMYIGTVSFSSSKRVSDEKRHARLYSLKFGKLVSLLFFKFWQPKSICHKHLFVHMLLLTTCCQREVTFINIVMRIKWSTKMNKCI